MGSAKPIPTALRVVAGLFVFEAVCAAIEVVVSLMHGHINLNFGVLGFLIGPGLIRLSRGWRTCALVFCWFALLGAPLLMLLMLGDSGSLDFKFLGQRVGRASRELGFIFGVIVFLLALWQYRVLTREDVRQLFGLPPGAPPSDPPE